MQKIDITYNPYKMDTQLLVDDINVCDSVEEYGQFKEFIETHTPLQTWIEPIPYKSWKGIINELKADEEGFDILEFHFHGRRIDFDDLKRVCETENSTRHNKLELVFKHETIISDEKLAQNIDVIMQSILSERFANLVNEQGEGTAVFNDYQHLEEDYERAKQKEFKIVFAGLYSSGKSTILNSLIRHNILPTSDKTCTAKTCRIRHNKKIKDRITLECFDRDGKVVVPKETFNNDEDCLERFWAITPLGSRVSVPESVDVIELELDLSHLYPNKEMEKAFNIVIIDTPGCNSRKKTGETEVQENNDEDIINTDKRLALEAITSGDREMVVVCADAQDYDDESLGDFLKAIHEASIEDVGDFNDRFLFVLNKCDALKFSRDENIADSKSDFADYLMDTKRWGIRHTSLKFVPRVFMISAYNYFALKQGVSSFSEVEIEASEEKQNLTDSYDDFYKKVIRRKNPNYFLSQVCDVPDYRKQQYRDEFFEAINKEEDKALEIQTGVCCIEGAIQDYIARYAYPLKVKNLIETFDLLLESVKEFSDAQAEVLQERLNDMGKDTTEREEVEKKKKDEEKKESALRMLKEKVEKEKEKISTIKLDVSKMQKVREDIDVKIETNPSIERIRKAKGNEKLSESELKRLTEDISKIFSEAWNSVDSTFSELSADYKARIGEICSVLNEIASQLKQYNISGYNFSSSLALKKIELRNSEELAKEIRQTKQEKTDWVTVKKRNPIKDIEYKKWQIFKRIGQYFAKDEIETLKEVHWTEYSLASLKGYITNISGAFKQLSTDAQRDYKNEVDNTKKNASKMADDVFRDVNAVVRRIGEYRKRIESLGGSIEDIRTEIETCNDTIGWLNHLIETIKEGGRVDE